jgi:hypothetical protein
MAHAQEQVINQSIGEPTQPLDISVPTPKTLGCNKREDRVHHLKVPWAGICTGGGQVRGKTPVSTTEDHRFLKCRGYPMTQTQRRRYSMASQVLNGLLNEQV